MQPLEQKRQKPFHSTMTALFLLLSYLVATVASVPTSVLAQNSEVTSNMMNLNSNKQNLQAASTNSNNNLPTNNNNNIKHNNNNNILMAKVKRSSSNDGMGNMASSGLNKKSSPEVLPPSFNMPASPSNDMNSNQQQQQEELQQLQQLQHQQPQQNQQSMQPGQNQLPITNTVYTLPSNSEIIAAVEAAAAAAALNQRDLEQRQAQYYGNIEDGYDSAATDYPMQPHKRGIMNTPQYMYDGLASAYGNVNPGNVYSANLATDYYNPYMNVGVGGIGGGSSVMPANDVGLVGVPNGYWSDDDGSVVYTDLQEMNDYAPVPRASSSYRSKAYDNLQNILNSEAYLESAAAAAPIPVQYAANRYYANLEGDQAKRNKFSSRYGDYRLKRDTKLTPADMLALVALVEAGERARQDNEDESRHQNDYNTNKNAFDYYGPVVEDGYEYGGNWYEPANQKANLNANPNGMDMYGMPLNLETIPKYDNKFAYNPYEPTNDNIGSKRYMIAKRKRSMGKFLNEPIGNANVGYNGDKYY